MPLKSLFRRWLRQCGYDLVRYAPASHPDARLQRMLETYGIELVLDVGANTGQFGRELRALGYQGRIVSFEPQQTAFAELNRRAARDGNWQAFNYALGDSPGAGTLNLAGNSFSSSLLEMLPAHVQFAPQSAVIGQQSTEIKTLDTVCEAIGAKGQPIFLKIDTQGFEPQVLRGAGHSLPLIDTIQLELSLLPLYRGEVLFAELYQWLTRAGYQLVSLRQGFSDEKTGQLLQVDAIFHRFAPQR